MLEKLAHGINISLPLPDPHARKPAGIGPIRHCGTVPGASVNSFAALPPTVESAIALSGRLPPPAQ